MYDPKEEKLVSVIRRDQNKMLGQLRDAEMNILFYEPYPNGQLFQGIEAAVIEALQADV